MLRAKSSIHNRYRIYRTLRLEPLERRTLLSTVVSTGSAPFITLCVANTITDYWDFEGTVTDKGHSVAGLTVQFGGVLKKYGLTATVEANGSYSITEELRNLTTGTATAQTHDAAGKSSNVAMDFVNVRSYSLQAGYPGTGSATQYRSIWGSLR